MSWAGGGVEVKRSRWIQGPWLMVRMWDRRERGKSKLSLSSRSGLLISTQLKGPC